MFELSKTDYCFDEQGHSRRIELSFTDGDKTIKHTMRPEDEAVVLEDVRHIYFYDYDEGVVLPFPELYHDFQYLGRLEYDYIFQARNSDNNDSRIVTISGDWPYLSKKIYNDDQGEHKEIGNYEDNDDWRITDLENLKLRVFRKGQNPTTDKLLEVNNAEKIYVFYGPARYRRMTMFSVSPEMVLSEIDFTLEENPFVPGIFFKLRPKKYHLLGVSYSGVYTARPDDIVKPGLLCWRKKY